MNKKTVFAALALLAASITTYADEGMWLVNMMEKGLIKDMRAAGLKLAPNVIYDDEAASLSDAVVAIDFFGTGSIISDKGLLITNHHVAYGDVHALSTPEHNYLEEGFRARNASEEIPIEGRSAFILRKVIDVTEKADSLLEDAARQGKPLGSRKLSHLLEKDLSEQYGMEASLGIMWRGTKYYVFLYDKYQDVRLVAAPPVSIAAFGGDIDNWEWPQHKGDFALYRIYAGPDGKPAPYSKANVPLKPRKHLAISTKGVKKGDYTMVMGYPGSTSRYSSSFQTKSDTHRKQLSSAGMMKERAEIIKEWSDRDESIRLKYADSYFNLTNVQELYLGTADAVRKYGIIGKKEAVEKELRQWLDSKNDGRTDLLDNLQKLYARSAAADDQLVYFRDGIIRSCTYYTIGMRIRSTLNGSKQDSTVLRDSEGFYAWAEALLDSTDPRVEHDIFVKSLEYYSKNAAPAYRSEVFNSMLADFDGDIDKMAQNIWDNSFLTDPDRLRSRIARPLSKKDLDNDIFFKVMYSTSMKDLNDAVSEAQLQDGSKPLLKQQQDYTKAIYEMRMEKGIPQYPDANSTLRLTYGNVDDLYPRDGVLYSERSTSEGILEKYDPEQYEFHLDDRQKELLETANWGRWAGKDGKMQVNFLTTNDITGGNSGSPVLDAHGNLVGLAFDGNKESLCCDVWFEDRYCKCVCVDIRYVMWILERYAGMDYLFDEMEFK